MDYRLKKNSDFQRIFSRGKKCFSNSLILLFIENKKELKVGYSVSKKHGKSNVRNRIKRLLRVAFFEIRKTFNLKNCYIIFIPKVLENYSVDNFKKDMLYMLNKSGVILNKKETTTSI